MIRARQRQYERYWQQYPFQEAFRPHRLYDPASLLDRARPPSLMEMYPYPFKPKYRHAPLLQHLPPHEERKTYPATEQTGHREPQNETNRIFRRTVMSVEPRRNQGRERGIAGIEAVMMGLLRRGLAEESKDDGDQPYPRSLLPMLNKPETRGLDLKVISSFRVTLARAKDVEKTCSICYSEFAKGDKIMRIKCRHTFHPKCVRKWFTQSKQCPNCRAVME